MHRRLPISPNVAASFYRTSAGFTACNGGPFVSCPPYVIADETLKNAGLIQLSRGVATSSLHYMTALTDFVDEDVQVTQRQAEELAVLGAQLLAWDTVGEIELGWKAEPIQHLIQVVTGA